MTDLKKLRELAEKATPTISYADNSPYWEYILATSPQAIIEILDRLERYEKALRFYAEGNHFEWLGKDELSPENPSGEPSNIECGGDDDNQFTLENGGLAREALEGGK